jgi:hypothetical protein
VARHDMERGMAEFVFLTNGMKPGLPEAA